MSAIHAPIGNPTVQNSLNFLDEMLRDAYPRAFAIRLWEGSAIPATEGQPTRFTLVLQRSVAPHVLLTNRT